MCLPDKNKALRRQAQIEKQNRDFQYQSEGLKFFNKTTSYLKNKDLAAKGYSKSLSDNKYAAIYTQGKANVAAADVFRKYVTKMNVNEGGKARQVREGRTNDLLATLAERSKIEDTIDKSWGIKLDTLNQGSMSQFLNFKAKNRESLGIAPSEYGPPTIMPGKNTGGIFGLATTAMSFVPGLQGLGVIGKFSKPLIGSN